MPCFAMRDDSVLPAENEPSSAPPERLDPGDHRLHSMPTVGEIEAGVIEHWADTVFRNDTAGHLLSLGRQLIARAEELSPGISVLNRP